MHYLNTVVWLMIKQIIFLSLFIPSIAFSAIDKPVDNIIYKAIKTPADIEDIKSRQVKPVAYTHVINLAKLDVKTKKKKFFNMMLPAILISKAQQDKKYQKVSRLNKAESINQQDEKWLADLRKRYRADNNHELMVRMHTHPSSIVLAQSAIETGWGTSRFFVKAMNAFGVWSYNKNEPRVKASETRNGKAIYVKKYASLNETIDDYFVTLGRGPYKKFRQQRLKNTNPLKLIQFLDQYSEIREKYVKRLRSVIKYNKLQRFDKYVLENT